MAVPNPTITPTGTVLALVGDPLLRDDVSRVAAAAGVGLVVVDEPSDGRLGWRLPRSYSTPRPAQRCAARALPRRTRVILVGSDAPRPDDWQAAHAQLAIDFRASGVPIAAPVGLRSARCEDPRGQRDVGRISRAASRQLVRSPFPEH